MEWKIVREVGTDLVALRVRPSPSQPRPPRDPTPLGVRIQIAESITTGQNS